MLNRQPIRWMALLLWATGLPCLSAQTANVEGTVRDVSGAVIVEASVVLSSGSYKSETQTDTDGHFLFSSVPSTSGTLEISREGFNPVRQSWNAGVATNVSLEIVLQLASASEQITVSAARTEVRLTETPGSTVLLTNTDVAATPALRVDDVLRQVPGFSLFRRSDSRTANASNQGVSLRGLGGTAASRALVLEDGLPLVDAFGGWVYWDRVPRASLANVEVFRGGASNLYGSDALGGVVQFITRQPQRPAFALDTSYGNERTPDLSFWTGTRVGRWDLALASEMFRTDGYIIVPTWQRGSVDTPANSEDATIDFTAGHQFGEKGRVFLRGTFYTEFRNNGTHVQTNDTIMGEGAVGLDRQFGTARSHCVWCGLRLRGERRTTLHHRHTYAKQCVGRAAADSRRLWGGSGALEQLDYHSRRAIRQLGQFQCEFNLYDRFWLMRCVSQHVVSITE